MKRYIVTAPIVATASVRVWAESEEDARVVGWEVLHDSTQVQINTDLDMDHEEVIAALEDDSDTEFVRHLYAHFGMEPNEERLLHLSSGEHLRRLSLAHRAIHEGSPTDHQHTDEELNAYDDS